MSDMSDDDSYMDHIYDNDTYPACQIEGLIKKLKIYINYSISDITSIKLKCNEINKFLNNNYMNKITSIKRYGKFIIIKISIFNINTTKFKNLKIGNETTFKDIKKQLKSVKDIYLVFNFGCDANFYIKNTTIKSNKSNNSNKIIEKSYFTPLVNLKKNNTNDNNDNNDNGNYKEYINISLIDSKSKSTQLVLMYKTYYGVSVNIYNDQKSYQKYIDSHGYDIYCLNNFTFNNFKDIIKKFIKTKPDIHISKVLIDQKMLVAGINNFMKSEILYDAKISPHKTLKQLTTTDIDNLYNSICIISDEMLEHGLENYNNRVYGKSKDNNNNIIKEFTPDHKITYWVKSIQN